MSDRETVVLAYSGGLDTSCILVWLIEQGYDVVTYMGNIGQEEDFEDSRRKAANLGAKKVIIDDVREEFVKEYIFPAVRAGLIYENRYLLGTSLARPCLAKRLIKVAKQENATYISHGATGKGNDQVRFELACYALCPSIKVIAPWRIPVFYERFQGRADLFEYAKEHNIPLPISRQAPWSIDANLMHISYESGILEDPWEATPKNLYSMTSETTPDEPDTCIIKYKNGFPVSVVTNNEEVTGELDMFCLLNKLGSIHGIGRTDMVENRFVGVKARCVYECPAGTILHVSHLDLESFCLDREVRRIKQYLMERMSEAVYNGFWFSPEFEFLNTCIAEAEKAVTGEVRLKLYKGNVYSEARKAEGGLYNVSLASMDEHSGYDPSNATGFIKIHAIRLTEHYRVKNK